ncbi:MAG: hypothetical protein F2727_04165, partial [Actinobacteria bacterium]|nr:hypothetical protein [Actinomycetota bacterium]
MTKKRLMAGAAALVVVAVGFSGLQGLAKAYGPTSVSLPGALFLNNTVAGATATTTNTFTDTITLSNSPSSPNAGDVVFVSLSGLNGPSTGPVSVGANGEIVRATISLTGAQTASVALTSYNNSSTGAAGTPACNYPAVGQAANSAGQTWATYGQFTASGNGSAALALNQLFFDDEGNDSNPTPTGDVCTGTANNADYYISAVTQTAGSGQPGIAKTAPADSTVVKNTFTITGPNAQVTFVGGTVTGAGSYTRGNTGDVRAATKNTAVGTVNLTGTVWGASKASADFTVELC